MAPPLPTRRLRLGELLAELGALDDEAAAASASVARGAQAITLGELVDRCAEAGFGFVIALLALLAIPFVGLSTPFGLAIGACGAQMLVGKRRPWLPGVVRRRRISLAMLDRVAGLLARRTRWLSRLTRHRGERLIDGAGFRLCGLGVLILGAGLALPLPIPGSNMIFLIPIFAYAIAALERDGALAALAHLAVLVDVALLLLFGHVVAGALAAAWAWIT